MTTVEGVMKQLTRSGLMGQEELRAFHRAGHFQAADGPGFAEALVRAGKLTRFQQSCILQNKSEVLRLGNYVILDKLGAGGMGTVYRARHRHMHRVVALKVLSRRLLRNREVVARFQREVHLAARLNHPHIVTAYDADVVGKVHFLVMQFVDGPNLQQYVREHGPLSVERTVELLIGVTEGLEYAHERGVVHRDIKPANLLLGGDGVVKVADMGVARLVERSGAAELRELTAPGEILGTLEYMAPEQAMNIQGNDLRSDIYSLGCTLHYLLTGEPVYRAEAPTQILLAHREQPIPNLADRCADAPKSLQRVFERMVAKSPDERYQDMGQVRRALEQVLDGAEGASSGNATGGAEPELANFLERMEDEGKAVPLPVPVVESPGPAEPLLDSTLPGVKADTRRGRAATAKRRPAAPQRRRVRKQRDSGAKKPQPQRQATGGRRPEGGSVRHGLPSPWIARGLLGGGALAVLCVMLTGVRFLAWPGDSPQIERSPGPGSVAERPPSVSGAPGFQGPAHSESGMGARDAAGAAASSGEEMAGASQPDPTGPDFALRFNGRDSFVEVPSIRFDPAQSFTLEATLHLPDSADPLVRTLIGWQDVIWVTYCSATRHFSVYANLADGTTAEATAEVRDPTRPVHLAVVWDPPLLRFYLDGERQGPPVLIKDLRESAAGELPLAIGAGLRLSADAQSPVPARCFEGMIDEIRISRMGRYTGNYTPLARLRSDEHTIGLFHCDEGKGSVLGDASGKKNTGELHGVNWVAVGSSR